jgi:endoglucanase
MNTDAPRDRAVSDRGEPTARRIPRWRGFNLQAKTSPPGEKFRESDFALMAEWGFDFARLPLSYWTWSSREDWFTVDERVLEDIDEAVEMGRRHGIHVNICLHRIPGYCVNGREHEPADLFSPRDEERAKALAGALFQWKLFARRYKGIPNSRISFDLLNEPPWTSSEEPYAGIVRALVAGIREIDPGRLIFADGINLGQTPVMGIAGLGVVQSTRGYLPKAVSHYTANWVPKNEFESFSEPTWPMTDDSGGIWDRARLKSECIDPWKPLTDRGVAVHVGEWGAFNKTPHRVVMAWMEDCLSLWKEAGWGYSLWQLRGAFGILDSGRSDAAYEDFKGHKLDRAMLELLRRY